METPISTVLIGLIATALTDIWGIIRHRLLHVLPPDYALVGRWIAHMRRGSFRHDDIKAAPPARNERALGWIVHYLAKARPVRWSQSLSHSRLDPEVVPTQRPARRPLRA